MIGSWLIQLRKGIAEMSILSILNNGESYGYEIIKALEKAPALAMKESSLYLLLNRLHKEGLIAVRHVQSEKGPKRRYYHLTPQGKEKYEEMIHHWDGVSRAVNDLITHNDNHQ